MRRSASIFISIAVLTGLLAALSIAVFQKGYAFGALGQGRLETLASGATFIALAALYAFTAALIMVVPLRAAGFLHTNIAEPLVATTIALLGAIVGTHAARFAFGAKNAPWELLDWRFLFAFALVAAHLVLNNLRRNALLRTLTFIVAVAAGLACLFWTFRF